MSASSPASPVPADLQQLVADADTGGRSPKGPVGLLLLAIAVAWSLAQLWYASPLPFALGWGVLNDTEARALHLGVGMFLAYLAFPLARFSPRDRVPLYDWILAIGAAFAGSYLYLFYNDIAQRPSQPTPMDLWVSVAGVLLLLEATRRAIGWPMAALAVIFLGYVFAGPLMPEILVHKGASVNRAVSHFWLTTEGVFGIALGVSVGFIFVFVLFGALLDRAGAGNYMMQVSFALLGHLRGGPAKVAVVSSGLNGLISGSSVSNVVSGGIFTIPLMKKAGYGGVKAGAIETMSSVNGQLMPPVMGAAAFLMVEYVGIPYSDIVRHAFLPAVISYIALFYITHLEALKLGMQPMAKARQRGWGDKLKAWALGLSGSIAVLGFVYYAIAGINAAFGGLALAAIALLLALLYVASLWFVARAPDLPPDINVDNPVLPETWPTVKAGLHFLLPIGVLIWALMVEELSPSLSAFWACAVLVALMVTQRPLIALFRGSAGQRRALLPEFRSGLREVLLGLNDGARNMIGIAVATGCAGIIVGTITLTGLGLRMTDFVEFVSMGNVMLMLIFIAFVCLVLGLGVPTTANYILVATLMAPVVVELGAQQGLVLPLIAVHLFVFYYGIMGDITPPVGLATFAAAAISKEDPIATGIQGSVYALRTVILPFVWIFNPALLMIDVHGWFEVALVAAASTLASCVFAAATMAWFRIRTTWWEVLLLLAATFVLFRPDWFTDWIAPEYRDAPPAELMKVVQSLPQDDRLVLVIRGQNIEGDDVTKTVAVALATPPADDEAGARKRLAEAGLGLGGIGATQAVSSVRFGSRAAKARIEQGYQIAAVKVPTGRASAHWFYVPGVLLVLLVWFTQGLRMRRAGAAPA
jgi:TRAP transporter 4TM/12TM fusion protein